MTFPNLADKKITLPMRPELVTVDDDRFKSPVEELQTWLQIFPAKQPATGRERAFHPAISIFGTIIVSALLWAGIVYVGSLIF